MVGLWGFCLGFGGERTWTRLLKATPGNRVPPLVRCLWEAGFSAKSFKTQDSSNSTTNPIWLVRGSPSFVPGSINSLHWG